MGKGGWVSKLQISVITVLFLKSTTGTSSQLRPVDAGHSQKGKKHQVSVTALRQTLRFSRGRRRHRRCMSRWAQAPSQHCGLDDNLRVLDVPFALDHPQLQQGRAGLLSFPSLGYGTDSA